MSIQAFLLKLQDHLLGRLLGRDFDGDTYGSFTPNDRQTLKILSRKIYSVQTCRLYYTTYDVQRQMDTVNPRTCANVMVHAPAPDGKDDAGEPYWYARVLGIYHAKVSTSHPDAVNGIFMGTVAGSRTRSQAWIPLCSPTKNWLRSVDG